MLSLPQESVSILGLQPLGQIRELIEGRRRLWYEILAIIKNARIRIGRNAVQPAVIHAGLEIGREVVFPVGRRDESGQIHQPACSGELRNPDYIGVDNVVGRIA